RAARNAEDPEALGLAAAMLSKLGLPQSGVLLDAIYSAQFATRAEVQRAAKLDPDTVPQVLMSPQQSAEMEASSTQQLAGLLTQLVQVDTPRKGSGFADDESRRQAQSALADRLLNAQTGGVVSHRYGLLPMLVEAGS